MAKQQTKKMKDKQEKVANTLAFPRQIDSSDAVFLAGKEMDPELKNFGPLPVREKAVRGVKEYRTAGQSSGNQVDKNILTPNPQRIDFASLGVDESVLGVKLNLRFQGGFRPTACSNRLVHNILKGVWDDYAEEHGFTELARRYALNIASGRFLWRNRVGAEDVKIYVTLRNDDGSVITEEPLVFNALEFELGEFDQEDDDGCLATLSGWIARTLSGKSFISAEIVALVKTAPGMEVFPSQELAQDSGKGKKEDKKGKHLYYVQHGNAQTAGMHPQKITNAIHTVDDWYPVDSEGEGPLSVNAYDTVTTLEEAFRPPGNKDFYTLLDKIVQDESAEGLEEGDHHFVMAMLVRGGVFGKSGKEEE